MIEFLDTTLRDGSYVVDFQFDKYDTTKIISALEQTGIQYIEIGHGMGLGAFKNPKMRAACSDEEYLQVAANTVKLAKWGMFFIPGIGKFEDIDMAAHYGMDFIRVGVDAHDITVAKPYIEKAKHSGMMVSINFMKTYVLSPEEIGKRAKYAQDMGADIVCIVDSAGGMLPEDVEKYCLSIKKSCDIPIGFHGHNNLQMAVANSLRAIDSGASVIDVSLRGLGRSSGNASLEIMAFILKRRKYQCSLDPIQLMNAAEQLIDPLLEKRSEKNSINIVSGYAQFHSSFLGIIMDYAERYRVDPRELIVCVCKEDRVNAPEALVDRLAKEMAQQKLSTTLNKREFSSIKTIFKLKQDVELQDQCQQICVEAKTRAAKQGKQLVFNIVQAMRSSIVSTVSSVINEGNSFTVISAEVASVYDLERILPSIILYADKILLDTDIKTEASYDILRTVYSSIDKRKMGLCLYSDSDLWAKSLFFLIKEKIKKNLFDLHILMMGSNLISEKCVSQLKSFGVNIYFEAVPKGQVIDVICCFKETDLYEVWHEISHQKPMIIDAMIGSLQTDTIIRLMAEDIFVYRPEMRAVIHDEISVNVRMHELIQNDQGIINYKHIRIAAGGIVAPAGTVIVDSIKWPTKILGIADGKGFLKVIETNEIEEALRVEVEAYISEREG